MESWKPLQPTSRQTSLPYSLGPEAYAAPAHSTRQAPPAHPHPYPTLPLGSNAPPSKRSSFFPWDVRGNASKYSATPEDVSPSPLAPGSTSKWIAPELSRSGSVRMTTDAGENVIGNLPVSTHAMIADLLPLGDVASYMLTCRGIAALIAREEFWKKRVRAVRWTAVKGISVETIGDHLFTPVPQLQVVSRSKEGETISRDDAQGEADGEGWTEFSSAVSDDAFPPSLPSADSNPITPSHAVSSYGVEVSAPSYGLLPSYRALKSYKVALKPLIDSLETSESPGNSLLFTTPLWGPLEQQALLGNAIRAVLPAPSGGGGLFALLNVPDSACDLLTSASPRGAGLLRSASLLTSHLLSMFTSSCDRRSDALRAGEHGVTGIKAAVDRAEGDMRAFAQAIWQLGTEAQKLSECCNCLDLHIEGDQEKASYSSLTSGGGEQYGDGAKAAWLQNQDAKNPLRWSTDPRSNIAVNSSQTPTLDFTPMDRTMSAVLAYILSEGGLIARIFPPEQGVLLEWGRVIADRLVTEYVRPLLETARSHSVHLFLRCCAATYTQSLRLADGLLHTTVPDRLPAPSALAGDTGLNREDMLNRESLAWQGHFRRVVTLEACYLTVYEAWEPLMADYLAEEREWNKSEMERVADEWEQDLINQAAASRVDAAFLTARNPAAVKRTVLSSFKDVLLLPVTVVPRTAVNVGGAVFRSAGKGVSHLNPLRWQGPTASDANRSDPMLTSSTNGEKGYIDFSNGGSEVDHYSSEDDKDDQTGQNNRGTGFDEWSEEVKAWKEVANKAANEAAHSKGAVTPVRRVGSTLGAVGRKDHGISAVIQGRRTPTSSSDRNTSRPLTPTTGIPNVNRQSTPSSLQHMQLLLSLDTALQMIHLNRDSLRRIETFSAFAGQFGVRVQAEIEEVASTFLQCLGEHHISPGFHKAILQITSWTPSEQIRRTKPVSETSKIPYEAEQEQHVEPLIHFFELVHVGDTIVQMVQVYFDQELSRHIDRTDFFNSVVREKKRLEKTLDEAVALGLNSGVDLLMGQIEHIVATSQDPRDFYPESISDMDLGKPTSACSEAIACLKTHCKMLIGCTDKNVLEVFWQEIGIRLHTIVCKHLKRQIISLEGGFKVIADLNAYYAFIASMKQASLLPYFEALKMLGNLYVIEDPRELASLVRDSSVFRGTLTPDDVYEFLQARCDFKAIEKAIDREIYGFKIAEDCSVM